MAEQRVNYDSPWKEMLELYFPQFLAFFFPDIHAAVDWSQPNEFLDKELQKVVRQADTGKRYVDKLVSVWRNNGQEAWVLIHVEVQGAQETGFSKRMYVYHYRLFDRYQHKVASLAILSDGSSTWHPTQYRNELWGVEVFFKFRTAKLLTYREQWAALERNTNPFAVVVMAHLKTQETQHDPQERGRWKWTLTRMLYERGYSRQDVLELFRFIDWLMALPPALEQQFAATLDAYQEEQSMKYVTTIERMAEERGLAKGTAETLRRNVLEILEIRFAQVPETLPQKLEEILRIDSLQTLHRTAVTAVSLQEFEWALDRVVADAKAEQPQDE